MTKIQRVGAAFLVCLSLGAAGCSSRDAATDGAGSSTGTDTGAVGGLSPEELRARAEPMSPEQAESLGIAVDTSIHVETPSGDTIPVPGPVGSPPPGTSIPPYPPSSPPRDTAH